jgi:hypothetical protein
VVLDTLGMMWCNSLIAFASRIWRDFGSALPFQTRLTQTSRFYHCQTSAAHRLSIKVDGSVAIISIKKFPYWPTRGVSLLSWHATYIMFPVQVRST